MRTLYRLVSGNVVPRLALGLLVVCFLYRGVVGQNANQAAAGTKLTKVVHAYPVRSATYVDLESKLINLAKTSHTGLLKWSMENYKRHVRDYQGTLRRRERVNGKLGKSQEISVKFKENPFSLVMEWKKNAGRIDKLLYVEKKQKRDNKMVVHPTGLFSWIKSVERDPKCKEARKSSRRTCDQFGFYRNMENMLEIYQQAGKQDDLQVRYLGEIKVGDRECVAIERRLPPKKDYPSARLVIAFDREYFLPISMTSYDWQGRLLGEYVYSDLKFNVGLTPQDFTRTKNRL